MAAPSYGTDLQIFDDCSSVANFTEPTGFTTTDGTGVADTDLSIYGTSCITESQRKAGSGGLFSTVGQPAGWTNGDCFFGWYKFFAPNATGTQASGSGIEMFVGSTNANFNRYYVAGSDTYAYGGWINYAVNPNTATVTPSATQGTPSGTHNGMGFGATLSYGISKGNAHNLDVFRWGRGELIVELGELLARGDASDTPAVFSAIATANDNPTTGRWGLFQDTGGSYLWKGLMSLGNATNSVAFKDANTIITIDNTEFVQADFNKVEIKNASSRVEWDAISITSLSTVAPGDFEVVDNAPVFLRGCTFNDMGTFTFQTNTTSSNSVYRNCGTITPAGASMSGDTIVNPKSIGMAWGTSTAADGLTDLTFDMADADNKIAIQINTASDFTISGHQFIGLGGTASYAVEYTGATNITLTPSGGSNITQAMVLNSGAGTATVAAPSVSLIIRNLRANSEVRVFRQSDGVEVGTGTESAVVSDTENAGRFQHTITHSQGGTAVNIVVAALGYQNVFIPYTLKSVDDSLLVSQIIDRTYNNP